MLLPENEEKRLAFVLNLHIIDTPIEERFERITRLVRRVFKVPAVTISIIDQDRVWFKSAYGIDVNEVERHNSFSQFTILGDTVLEIPDVTADDRFGANPLLIGTEAVRFYAGFPLTMAADLNIGDLSIYDTTPRNLDPEDIQAMHDFGQTAANEIKARLMRYVYND